ncbi:hypothetical protein BDZ89DRAFT_210412 [Hymenopellis radicata]|nr:hypothetical protein BDZ89DRAFT_210412 [Hymenopellis radicata]
MTAAPATTAQDLLFSDVLVGGKRPTSRSVSGEQHRFFPIKSEARSIWATASDEPVQINAGRNNHSPYVHPRSFGMDVDAASWPRSCHRRRPPFRQRRTRKVRNYIPGSLPSAPFALRLSRWLGTTLALRRDARWFGVEFPSQSIAVYG